MGKEKILVVEDEEDILELVRFSLSQEGYPVICVTNGEDALALAETTSPDLIVLDLMLPGIDGLEVCRKVRERGKAQAAKIIMLTAKSQESDIVKGLEAGADDYLTKPFSPKVLVARVRALLRRNEVPAAGGESDVLQIEKLYIHPGRHEVRLDGKALDLTVSEFRILHFLARHPGWVFSRYQIVDAVKGEDYPVTERSVDVQMVGLRRKLGSFDYYIETVRGVGYRFHETGTAEG